VAEFSDEEEPTTRDESNTSQALMLARLFKLLAPIDQLKLTRIIEAYVTADIDERIVRDFASERLVAKRKK